jgi:hypothetical protein
MVSVVMQLSVRSLSVVSMVDGLACGMRRLTQAAGDGVNAELHKLFWHQPYHQ